MMFDKETFKKRLKDLEKDIETGEMKASAWLWVMGGAAAGLLASCVKIAPKIKEIAEKTIRPIIAKMDKVGKKTEDK